MNWPIWLESSLDMDICWSYIPTEYQPHRYDHQFWNAVYSSDSKCIFGKVCPFWLGPTTWWWCPPSTECTVCSVLNTYRTIILTPLFPILFCTWPTSTPVIECQTVHSYTSISISTLKCISGSIVHAMSDCFHTILANTFQDYEWMVVWRVEYDRHSISMNPNSWLLIYLVTLTKCIC